MTTATSELSVFVERKPGWIVEMTVEAPPGELDRALGEAGRNPGMRSRARLPPGWSSAPSGGRLCATPRPRSSFPSSTLVPSTRSTSTPSATPP